MESKLGALYQGDCRICEAKGNHRNINKEYLWNGIQEVYFDIFLECYNLFLTTTDNVSNLICNSCVRRLRDAYSFRCLVVEAEKRLTGNTLESKSDPATTIFVNVPNNQVIHHEPELEIKIEEPIEVKQELNQEEEDSDRVFFDDDVSSDDLPLKSSKSDVNIDLLTKEAALISRFPRDKLKMLPTREKLYMYCKSYVQHLDELKGKLILPEMLTKLLSNEQNSLSKKVFLTEKMAHIRNATTLLEFSNAIPFRSKSRSAGFPCFYCHVLFENSEKLRKHQFSEHDKSEIKHILGVLGAECLIVYVDVTDLKCTICDMNIPNLNELKSHLTKVHKKRMHLEYNDRVIPFKLPPKLNDVFECQICGFGFETFGSIERHMNVHYRNYVCKECGTGFVTRYRLKVHTKSMHVGGNFPCEVCQKIFTTQQKYKNHVDTVHKQVKRFKCTKCPERFTEYFRRQKHLVEMHGVAPLLYKCNVCDKAFDRRYSLSRHMKRDHLEERNFQCDVCTYKCFTGNELRVHMIKHNGERIYECSVCKKSYARKKTLREHIRIHNNDRRFSCPVCGQAFVQKCSLKGHMKTHHIEYSLQ